MDKQQGNKKQTYEAPEIIYEGEITTRAGSQFPGPKGEYDVDPSKLFGSVD